MPAGNLAYGNFQPGGVLCRGLAHWLAWSWVSLSPRPTWAESSEASTMGSLSPSRCMPLPPSPCTPPPGPALPLLLDVHHVCILHLPATWKTITMLAWWHMLRRQSIQRAPIVSTKTRLCLDTRSNQLQDLVQDKSDAGVQGDLQLLQSLSRALQMLLFVQNIALNAEADAVAAPISDHL